MYSSDITRETKSICPVCLELLDAFVVQKSGRIFLSKTCPQHGQFEIILSRSPLYYKKLDEFYFAVMDEEKKLFEYEIWPTLKCNMNCIICHLGNTKQESEILEPSCTEIEDFVKKCKAPFYTLSGGEPTCREDLDKIIQVFKKYHKVVRINTNGIKLTDKRYLNDLKKAGLDRVNLQFDGFNRKAYMLLRGVDLLDIKLKVLENLNALNMPTDLNVTIARNVNEEDVAELIDYAAKNDFINGVNFFTICFLGDVRDWPLANYIMPDEVVDIIEEKTNYKITRKNVFLFQKLHLAIKSWLKQRFCLYSQIYILVRRKNYYEPIDRYLNLYKAQLFVDKYQSIYKKNKFLARTLLLITLPVSLFRWSSFKIIKELIFTAFSYFFHTSKYLKSKGFLYLSFSTGCDPYKVDYGLVRNCQDEIIHLNSNSGKLENHGRDGLYCMALDKIRFLNKNKNL
jgi:pyruvate-formate lyase-activating enzyme